MSFGGTGFLVVCGRVERSKFFETKNGHACMEFTISRKQYRGKDAEAEWVNYSIKVFGKTAEVLEGQSQFGDGAIVACCASHDQRKVENDNGVRVYNNLTTNDLQIVLSLGDVAAPFGGGDKAPAPGEDDDGLGY